jgi:hypothetical protein
LSAADFSNCPDTINFLTTTVDSLALEFWSVLLPESALGAFFEAHRTQLNPSSRPSAATFPVTKVHMSQSDSLIHPPEAFEVAARGSGPEGLWICPAAFALNLRIFDPGTYSAQFIPPIS